MEIKQEDYLKQFTEEQRKADLKIALETRKFEIEMYWKRATYFWAFIASSFAGYFVMLSNAHNEMPVIVALIGFCFSVGWYFVNRGSKFWQENWEAHIAELEKEELGPLFDIILRPKAKFVEFRENYPFSVSKVNQILSLFTTIIWIALFLRSMYIMVNGLCYCLQIILMITSLIILSGIVWLFFWSSKSFAAGYFQHKSKFFKKD